MATVCLVNLGQLLGEPLRVQYVAPTAAFWVRNADAGLRPYRRQNLNFNTIRKCDGYCHIARADFRVRQPSPEQMLQILDDALRLPPRHSGIVHGEQNIDITQPVNKSVLGNGTAE